MLAQFFELCLVTSQILRDDPISANQFLTLRQFTIYGNLYLFLLSLSSKAKYISSERDGGYSRLSLHFKLATDVDSLIIAR